MVDQTNILHQGRYDVIVLQQACNVNQKWRGAWEVIILRKPFKKRWCPIMVALYRNTYQSASHELLHSWNSGLTHKGSAVNFTLFSQFSDLLQLVNIFTWHCLRNITNSMDWCSYFSPWSPMYVKVSPLNHCKELLFWLCKVPDCLCHKVVHRY